MYTQVGDVFDENVFLNEGMFPVQVNKCKSARFVHILPNGEVHFRGWGGVLLLASVRMYFSTREEEYVLVVNKGLLEKETVVFRGTCYECALFIARRTRAFGFNIYATDVPMDPLEDSHEA